MREALLTRALVTKAKQNGYFFLGLAVGLWIALVAVPLEDPPVAPCVAPQPAVDSDEYEPAHTVRPPSAAGPSRSLTRPRYYTTELGVRAPLLAAVLTTEDALETMGAALNATMRALQPALRLFSAAAGRRAVPRPNVVGFTDARVTLTPFHALKYLADNHLDDYHFFFLVSDTTYVNAKRLQELVSRLSVSRDVYMGVPAGDGAGGAGEGGQYCALEGGVLLSRSVLQAVHGELDWCVRNAYSQQHHENVGRCVLHAAKVGCTSSAQGERYLALPVPASGALVPELADAVAVHPVTNPRHLHQIHAYTCRVHLQRLRSEERRIVAILPSLRKRHPPSYRNATWPPGLRADTGLSAPPPASRWDHIRWTPFNETHALMPNDHKAVNTLHAATKCAIDAVVAEAAAWTGRVWGGRDVTLVEGAWLWEPPTALRYRLLLRGGWATTGGGGGTRYTSVRQLELVRAVGGARLVGAPYVTESARVRLVLWVRAAPAPVDRARAFVRRYIDNKQRNDNTALTVVVFTATGDECPASCEAAVHALRSDVATHGHQYLSAPLEGAGSVSRAALLLAANKAPPHALLLLLHPDLDYSDDMLNRVRMNTIAGYQWYLPVPFARYALYDHPLFVDGAGNKPSQRTGHFTGDSHDLALAVYNTDVAAAMVKCGDDPTLSAAELVHCSGLRVLRAPEPGLLRPPQGPPCPLRHDDEYESCLHAAAADLHSLQLGAPNDLAKLLLQTNA